jgi:hypothetical protein
LVVRDALSNEEVEVGGDAETSNIAYFALLA